MQPFKHGVRVLEFVTDVRHPLCNIVARRFLQNPQELSETGTPAPDKIAYRSGRWHHTDSLK